MEGRRRFYDEKGNIPPMSPNSRASSLAMLANRSHRLGRHPDDTRNIFRTFRESSSSVAITRFTCDSVDASSGAYLMASYSWLAESAARCATVRLCRTRPASAAIRVRSPRSCRRPRIWYRSEVWLVAAIRSILIKI